MSKSYPLSLIAVILGVSGTAALWTIPVSGRAEGTVDFDNRPELVLPELGQGGGHTPVNDTGAQSASSAVQTMGSLDWNNMTGDRAKKQAEGWLRGEMTNRLVDPLQQRAQELLGKFGNAQINIAVDDQGDFSKSSFSLFTPWAETDSMVTFTQMGLHDQDSRTIGNFGAGIRWDKGEWLFGYNTFLDQDFSRNHSRLGLGAELWTDSLRLASNYYHPLSDWKDSPDFDDYEERPARGFDVRLQGYLPAYPHIGTSLIWEQYYGNEVALFGKESLQKDPRAVTFGLDYTPFPLATVKLSHKEGQQGKNSTQLDLQLNYQLGTPLEMQLDPDNVAAMRSLRGSRYDRVDRNYDIVLEYREKAGLLLVDLAFVPDSLLEGDTHVMQPLAKNKYRITGVTWHGDTGPLSLLATAGTTTPQGWKITLPAWDPAPEATNLYRLSLTLEDERGHKATSNTVDIIVGHQRQGTLKLETTDTVPASGLDSDFISLVAYLHNHLGVPVSHPQLEPDWIVTDVSTGEVVPVKGPGENCPVDAQNQQQPCLRAVLMDTEEREGVHHYVAALASSRPGTYQVRARMNASIETSAKTVTFTGISPSLVARAEIHDPSGRDLLSEGLHPQVGINYTVKLFDAGNNDITASVPAETVRWSLDGTNTAGCNVTLSSHDTGVTGYQFTPRTNSNSNSGVACGDQGFGLKVHW
ncbi:TPA: inverse autotransporter beta domain-containing protein [Citrobacter koseri]|nr:inverse autotransporter beta domain-containing protein [Citrobacter koseri]